LVTIHGGRARLAFGADREEATQAVNALEQRLANKIEPTVTWWSTLDAQLPGALFELLIRGDAL